MAEARVAEYQRLIVQLKAGSAHTPELLDQLRQVCLDLTNDLASKHRDDSDYASEVSNLAKVLQYGAQRVRGLSDLAVPNAMPTKVLQRLLPLLCQLGAHHGAYSDLCALCAWLAIPILTHCVPTRAPPGNAELLAAELASALRACASTLQPRFTQSAVPELAPLAQAFALQSEAPGAPRVAFSTPLTTGAATALLGWLLPLVVHVQSAQARALLPHLPIVLAALSVAFRHVPLSSLAPALHALTVVATRPDMRAALAAHESAPGGLSACCHILSAHNSSSTPKAFAAAARLLPALVRALEDSALFRAEDLRAAALPACLAALAAITDSAAAGEVAEASATLLQLSRRLLLNMGAAAMRRELQSVDSAVLEKLAAITGPRLDGYEAGPAAAAAAAASDRQEACGANVAEQRPVKRARASVESDSENGGDPRNGGTVHIEQKQASGRAGRLCFDGDGQQDWAAVKRDALALRCRCALVCCPQEHVAELDALLVAVSGHLNRHAATSKAQGHAAHCLDGLQAVLHTAALTLEALLLDGLDQITAEQRRSLEPRLVATLRSASTLVATLQGGPARHAACIAAYIASRLAHSSLHAAMRHFTAAAPDSTAEEGLTPVAGEAAVITYATSGAPPGQRQAVWDALHAATALQSVARGGVPSLLQSASPWSLAGLAAQEAPAVSLSSAAFTLSLLCTAPYASAEAILPLTLANASLLGSHATTSSHVEQARQAACSLLASTDAPCSDVAEQVAILLLKEQPWAAEGASLYDAELAVYSIALGLRKRSGDASCVEPPGALLEVALAACGGHTDAECLDFVAAVAAIEAHAPERALADAVDAQLVPHVCDALARCEPACARWHMAIAAAAWRLHSDAERGLLLWALAKKLTHTDVSVEVAAADTLQGLAQSQGCSVKALLVNNPRTMLEAGLHASSHKQVLQELTLVAPGTSAAELAQHALYACVGELCVREEQTALLALAELCHTTPAALVARHLPLIISHGLWQAGSSSQGMTAVSEGMIAFVEECLQGSGTDAPEDATCLDAVLSQPGVMACTKLETVYAAAHARRWRDGDEGLAESVDLCRTFLETLAALESSRAGAGGGAPVATGVRRLLSVETVEFVVQLLGSTLSHMAQGSGRRGDGQTVSQSLERDPLQCVRAIIVVIALLGEHSKTHTLKLMAALAAGMNAAFAGAVREEAMHGWRALVRSLVAHSPDMLRQVAPQIISHLMVVLGERPAAGRGGQGADELAAAEEVLHMLVVQHGGALGDDVLASIPSLPESVPVARLTEIQQVLASAQAGKTFSDRIRLLVQSLNKQSAHMKHAALGNLSRRLAACPHDAAAMTSASEALVPPCRVGDEAKPTLAAQLLHALLRCCDLGRLPGGDDREAMYQRLASCLGQLGALDPSKIRLKQAPPVAILEAPEDLLATVLVHVLRILRTALLLDLVDFGTYAMHKLLKMKIAGAQPGRESDAAILKRLSREDQAFAALNMDGVTLDFRTVSSSNTPPGCIITSGPGGHALTFRKWLDLWIRQTLLRCPEGDARTVLDNVAFTHRYDVELMLFILPHVLFLAVTAPAATESAAQMECDGEAPPPRVDGPAAAAAVLREMCHVAERCCPPRTGDSPTGGMQARPDEALHLQAVMSALDSLQRWRHQARAKIASARRKRDDSESAARKRGTAPPGPPSAQHTDLVRKADALGRFHDALLEPEESEQLSGSDEPRVPLERLALASQQCGAHARALRHYETVLRKRKGLLNNAAPGSSGVVFSDAEVTDLMHIYQGVQDPEALAGITQLRHGGPTRSDCILAAQMLGRWSEAAAFHEVELGAAAAPNNAAFSGAAEALQHASAAALPEAYLQSFLSAGKPRLLLRVAEGCLSRAADVQSKVHAAAAGTAAAWRLTDWAAAERFLAAMPPVPEAQLSEDHRWELCVGAVLLRAHQGDRDGARAALQHERMLLTVQMGPAGLESYPRAHPLMVKFHMLWDLQQLVGLGKAAAARCTEDALRAAMARIASTVVDVESLTRMLALVRAVAHMHALPAVAADAWLQGAAACRRAGHADAAWPQVLEAERAGAAGAFKLRAKLLWDAARHKEAIWAVRHGLDALVATPAATRGQHIDLTGGASDDADKLEARARLRLLAWRVEQGHGHTGQLQKDFDAVVRARPHDDKAHLEYAVFLRKIYEDLRQRQLSVAGVSGTQAPPVATAMAAQEDPHTYVDFVRPIIAAYSNVVIHGRKRALHALPRLLTALVEFGADAVKVDAALAGKGASGAAAAMLERLKQAAEQHLGEITATFDAQRKQAAQWKLLPAVTQVVSNIVHPQAQIRLQIQRFLAGSCKAYPNQCLWLLAGVHNSSNAERKGGATTVLQHVRSQVKDAATKALLAGHEALCSGLMELAEWDDRRGGGSRATVHSVKSISRALAGVRNSPVMVPMLQSFDAGHGCGAGAVDGSALDSVVTIQGIDDDVHVMLSLSRPKRMHFVGSDGHRYRFLAKPSDDLRRDMRVMEYAALLNRLIADDAASCRRGTKVQTFMCLPLADSGGVVEWVLNTQTYHSILRETYANANKPAATSHSRAEWDTAKARMGKPPKDPQALAKWFRARLDVAPPVMHEWWLATKSDPSMWLEARNTFARTSAAWSMAGHIVGLGDRHCDNLLIDLVSGANVQIDFGVLFDQGLLLPVPEIVPFRLTQNMVDSFGVCGVEGPFRINCGVVLETLRKHQQVIVGLLQAIASDPFVEWEQQNAAGRSGGRLGRSNRSSTSTAGNAKAQQAMAVIQGSLQGVLAGAKRHRCRPMTVDAQVEFLIKEATDTDKLSRMFFGWLPFL